MFSMADKHFHSASSHNTTIQFVGMAEQNEQTHPLYASDRDAVDALLGHQGEPGPDQLTTAARLVMRYADFVQWIDADAPDGFADLAAFNAALRKHLVRHRTLARDPDGFSTRNGRHTLGSLFRDRAPVLQAMERTIHRAVERYVAATERLLDKLIEQSENKAKEPLQ